MDCKPMKKSYLKTCLEKSTGDIRHVSLCMFQKLIKAWQDPKYDVDIMLCILHLIWSIGLWFSIAHPSNFQSHTVSMTLDMGGKQVWAIPAFILGVAHYISVFTRKPIFRISIFALSIVWGLTISIAIYYSFGPNMAYMMYMLLFVYMPYRKMSNILAVSRQDFEKEKSFFRQSTNNEGAYDERGGNP